jgi:hypothetical protein
MLLFQNDRVSSTTVTNAYGTDSNDPASRASRSTLHRTRPTNPILLN